MIAIVQFKALPGRRFEIEESEGTYHCSSKEGNDCAFAYEESPNCEKAAGAISCINNEIIFKEVK